jgi:hypothetical protein
MDEDALFMQTDKGATEAGGEMAFGQGLPRILTLLG